MGLVGGVMIVDNRGKGAGKGLLAVIHIFRAKLTGKRPFIFCKILRLE